ncbi:MAG: hypothetical protein ACOYKZ_00765 [Chlamydiia bacterium]
MGEFHNGQPSGHGVLTSSQGSTDTGSFVDGHMEGRGHIQYADGRERSAYFSHGTMIPPPPPMPKKPPVPPPRQPPPIAT